MTGSKIEITDEMVLEGQIAFTMRAFEMTREDALAAFDEDSEGGKQEALDCFRAVIEAVAPLIIERCAEVAEHSPYFETDVAAAIRALKEG